MLDKNSGRILPLFLFVLYQLSIDKIYTYFCKNKHS